MNRNLIIGLKFTPLVISVILILIILLFFHMLPAKLPLFYSLAWGDRQLATQKEFLIIPVVIILVTLLNFAISSQLHFSQRFFRIVLSVSSYVITLILLITFIRVSLMFV